MRDKPAAAVLALLVPLPLKRWLRHAAAAATLYFVPYFQHCASSPSLLTSRPALVTAESAHSWLVMAYAPTPSKPPAWETAMAHPSPTSSTTTGERLGIVLVLLFKDRFRQASGCSPVGVVFSRLALTALHSNSGVCSSRSASIVGAPPSTNLNCCIFTAVNISVAANPPPHPFS